jgi:diphosphomevalonate decarboxylase
MWIESSAASNIALIKYMGKIVGSDPSISNKPANVSVSYTLDNLKTYVRLLRNDSLTDDTWQAFERSERAAQNF